jgi:hypothetical protein
VPPDLPDRARAAAAAQPDAALALFTEWGSRTSGVLRVAALRGHGWASVVDDYMPTQALILPAPLAGALAGYLRTQPDDTPDDHAVLAFLRREGIPARVAVPNLVDHDDGPSLIGNRPMGLRRSACFSPPPDDLGAVVTDLADVPYLSWWNLMAECWTRTPDGGWRREPLPAFLARRCRDIAGVHDLCAEACHRSAIGSSTGQLLHRDLMAGLWQTAFALTLSAVRPGSGPAGRAGPDGYDPDGRVAAAALRSLAPGALRRVIDPRAAGDAYRPLHDLARHAAEAALTTAWEPP